MSKSWGKKWIFFLFQSVWVPGLWCNIICCSATADGREGNSYLKDLVNGFVSENLNLENG